MGNSRAMAPEKSQRERTISLLPVVIPPSYRLLGNGFHHQSKFTGSSFRGREEAYETPEDTIQKSARNTGNTKSWPQDSLWAHSSQAKTVFILTEIQSSAELTPGFFFFFLFKLGLVFIWFVWLCFFFLINHLCHEKVYHELVHWIPMIICFLLMHLTTLNFSKPRTQLVVWDHQNRYHTKKKGLKV